MVEKEPHYANANYIYVENANYKAEYTPIRRTKMTDYLEIRYGGDVRKLDVSDIVGGSKIWHNHHGKLFGSFL